MARTRPAAALKCVSDEATYSAQRQLWAAYFNARAAQLTDATPNQLTLLKTVTWQTWKACMAANGVRIVEPTNADTV